jgi:hypothetical protein
MYENGGADDFNLVAIEFEFVINFSNQIFGLSKSVIAFPVTSNE